jgi:proton-dependent oligopeptide transporter, POT family
MFKGHPKGLYVAFFANMGERFGYYTMIAIFVLYLQAKFGWSTTDAGHVYGFFLFGVYFLPLLGGLISDNLLGYGKTILVGIIVMFLGYGLLALPGTGEIFIYCALGVIALGTGLFKGNLQALVGNMYDDPKYKDLRDSAFNVFYMGINIGAFFAPSAAQGMRSWILSNHGLAYDKAIPDLAHKCLEKTATPENLAQLEQFARAQMGSHFTTIQDFCTNYITTISQAYNAGFAVAGLSIIMSLIIFIGFRKYYKSADVTHKQQKAENVANLVHLTPAQTKDRLIALGLVFIVVMFFWMAFHQNGFTLTIFARDYTVATVSRGTAIVFNLATLLPILFIILGIYLVLGKNNSIKTRVYGGIVTIAAIAVAIYTISLLQPDGNPISPEIFQQFNPIFIVFLTPVIIGFFSYLRKNGKEPSSPKKIGIGMIITAIGFLIMVLASQGQQSPAELHGGASDSLQSPYWLIGTYFTLTIAELFLSPIGISFVSKVAPPQLKGLAQGGWFGATAIGNLMAGFIGPFWDKWQLWQFFLLLVALTTLSAIIMFSILKRLERASTS